MLNAGAFPVRRAAQRRNDRPEHLDVFAAVIVVDMAMICRDDRRGAPDGDFSFT